MLTKQIYLFLWWCITAINKQMCLPKDHTTSEKHTTNTVTISASCTMEQSSFIVLHNIQDDVIDYVEKAQSADFETAIHFSKYGKFQALLLTVCGTIYATCAISTTTLSFVLPSAECDFVMSSMDKGKLSAMPLIGMIFGCGLWGSIADSHGRKTAIIASLSVDFLAAVTSAFAQNFQLFLICRFFNGFGIIGATSIIFSYLGEFASKKHRDVMLGRLEIFWNIGIIIIPVLAWLLLNQSMANTFEDYDGNFSPWRIFVLVCALPSLISLVMLSFLPETPKFLIAKGEFGKAKAVFQKVFTFNTGKPFYMYPVMTLEGEYENNNSKEDSSMELEIPAKLVGKLQSVLSDFKQLFSQPYLKYLAIASFADFGLMASYYTLVMWFPEIFERFNQYETAHPDSSAGVCVVSQLSTDVEEMYPAPCDPSIDVRVFLDTMIIGLSCIPSSVLLSFFMNKFGKKFVLICGLCLSGLSTLSLSWVQSSTETLVLSCIFEALTSIMEAVIFCVIVDLFPTNLRSIALAITATSGRTGAILGNMIFGLLIDLHCAIPIYLFGILLIGSGMMCVAIPQSDNYLVLH